MVLFAGDVIDESGGLIPKSCSKSSSNAISGSYLLGLMFDSLLAFSVFYPVFFSTGHDNNNDNELARALKQVLDDDSFKVKAPATIAARKSADELLNWCLGTKNSEFLEDFTKHLADSLTKVIKASSTRSFAYNNDKLWKKNFLLRSSPEFIKWWTTFLKPTGVAVKPVLFQHLTDNIFRKFLNDHF